MIFNKNDVIVFAGDSITDCGREYPSGEGAPVKNPFGSGYVSLVFSYLYAKYPELHLRIINKGIGGNRSSDLVKRYNDDILAHNPNLVYLMIGVNDVWRHFDTPYQVGSHLTKEEYKNNLETMIKMTLTKKSKLIILSPFFLEANKEDLMRKMLDEFTLEAKALSKQYNLLFIDIQKAFDNVLKHITTHELSRDRVHPNITGHMIIANEIINNI